MGGVSERRLRRLQEVFKTLSVYLRLKMLVLLAEKPRYAYELSKLLGISYPLVHLHLRALERVGLVRSEYEVTEGGRVRKYYRLRDFEIVLTPEELRKLGGSDEG